MTLADQVAAALRECEEAITRYVRSLDDASTMSPGIRRANLVSSIRAYGELCRQEGYERGYGARLEDYHD